jgi:hypothetical protein
MKLAHVSILGLVALSLSAAAGCTAPTGSSTEGSSSAADPAPTGHIHLMLTDQARAASGLGDSKITTERGRTGGSTLTYYGGPVVQSINVHPIFWNANVQNQSAISSFYSAIVTGAEMSFLSAYSTTNPAQHIGNGSAAAAVTWSQTGTSVTDAQVQADLVAAFNSGALPKPNNNTYYPIHFPSGVSISDGSSSVSCVQFCAYHGTGTYNGQDFYYGILPDLSQSGCAGGCGASTVVNNTTSVASHEYAETVTDPAVGLATVYGPPLGWYNASKGEIGDICNGQQTTAVLGDGKSYTVQKLWSNSANSCVTP